MPIGMTFDDISAVLNDINAHATGQTAQQQIVDTSSFVSVAEATLRTGTDNVLNAISQVLTRTIYAIRPYNSMLPRLEMSADDWGNHVRKINYFDQPAIEDKTFNLPIDGQSVDHYIIQRPKTLQTNYYGQTNYSRFYTRFDTQLKSAFTGPDQLADFWSGIVLHMSNQIEQDRQDLALNLLANQATGITQTSPGSVIYLLDEYNAQTGKNLTVNTVYDPANFPDFARFAFARINDISDLMRARSTSFHQNWNINSTDYNFMRHTPYDRQHLYLYSGVQRQIDSRVLTTTFNEGMLKYRDYELLPYWQKISDRSSISARPMITSTSGEATPATQSITLSNVFGMLLDFDSVGYNPIDNKVIATPVNARGQYINFWYHYNWRWYSDFTENGVVFLLTAGDVVKSAAPSKAAKMLRSNKVVEDDKTT